MQGVDPDPARRRIRVDVVCIAVVNAARAPSSTGEAGSSAVAPAASESVTAARAAGSSPAGGAGCAR
ncbi:hypothetical protein WHI96_18390 [Pseudonocardia tropica]|uniref:Uncharacterized protein n=1 Tax=Pseudonocardia tropica TaxID=681289 RepID=A0ABV1K094_9PSEU